MSFTPSTTFGKWAYLAMKHGKLTHVKIQQEINHKTSRGLSRMTSNAWFLLHGMKRLHGAGETKEMVK